MCFSYLFVNVGSVKKRGDKWLHSHTFLYSFFQDCCSHTNSRIVSLVNFLLAMVITMWKNCRQYRRNRVGAIDNRCLMRLFHWNIGNLTTATLQKRELGSNFRWQRVVHSWSILFKKCCSARLPSSLWLIIASATEGMWPTASAAPSELFDSGSVDVTTFLSLGVDTVI